MADKSNALRYAHELWLRVFDEVRGDYPEIDARHVYIDALCLHLVQDPSEFEVIVTSNLFGDIVTDLAAAFQGGLGMPASANVHPLDPARVGLFEPVHGSAPDLAGRGVANPCGALLSVGLMLAYLGYPEEEQRIEGAVRGALAAGAGTPDIGGTLDSAALTTRILEHLNGS
jgi:3-isopropylmalate dehydrogenase